ncbi:hypothetical protein WA026_022551 [Henosepilachna vigintioctopunctata]|uniref:DNA endonuclease activator Ctp1 C-terminal domain-containing protein n=1 Tax=Henosepilachna vigintioctopunctata TaxID=420089 RepID=A0AAW1VAZ8_9CUCU
MDCLLNDWMELFDKKNFENFEYVPKELKKAAMLFNTLKNEFRRVEVSLSQKMETLQSAYLSKTNVNIISDFEKCNPLSIISSPTKENISNRVTNIPDTKTLLKSPTLNRHRTKQNLKKVRQFNPPSFSSGLLSHTKLNILTSKTLTSDNKTLSDTVEDNDILDCSIIATTPNINIKKYNSKRISPRKRLKSTSTLKNTTLTQIFNEIDSKQENTKDESMIGIDEIIDKIDCQETQLNIPEDINMSSFVADYDKLPPVISNSPKEKYAFKETVRGKEKKKLKGWSCKDCEDFYKLMNLSERELEKKMDECSKHRSRFKPDEETIPGYWDLSIPPTPEDQNFPIISNKEESIGNDSTIFCLYKN